MGGLVCAGLMDAFTCVFRNRNEWIGYYSLVFVYGLMVIHARTVAMYYRY